MLETSIPRTKTKVRMVVVRFRILATVLLHVPFAKISFPSPEKRDYRKLAFVCATSKKKRKQHWHCRNCLLGSALMWGIVKYRGRRRANQRPASLPLIEFSN